MEDEKELKEHPNYVQELVSIIQSNISPMALKEKLSDYHDSDIADALEELSPQDREKLYRILEKDSLANILEYAEDTSTYLNELSVKKKIAVLSSMETDKAAEYLKTLPGGYTDIVITPRAFGNILLFRSCLIFIAKLWIVPCSNSLAFSLPINLWEVF